MEFLVLLILAAIALIADELLGAIRSAHLAREDPFLACKPASENRRLGRYGASRRPCSSGAAEAGWFPPIS